MSKKRIIITGATGMIGGCALRICLDNPDVSLVTAIGRSHTGIHDDRLAEVVVDDLSDYSVLADILKNQNTALFCLGAYTGAVPDDLFRQITVDYTLTFAKALHKASPQAAFCFLSGQGADQTEKSRMAFARYKGSAEKTLLEIGFPLLRRIYPNIGISSEDLAAAMVHAGLYGIRDNKNAILENKDIRSMNATRY